jgi:GDP-L-fucose synthase
MKRDDLIFVAGHRGLVGSALVRRLQADGFDKLLLRTRAELDLTRPDDVLAFFEQHSPRYVFLAAARVGGIHANATWPAEFIRDNLLIELSVIDAAYRAGTERLLFLGSSCVYPRLAPQPMSENDLLGGPLEPTNEAYAIAKIAGIRMCDAYRTQYGAEFFSAMPTNLYGPGDNFDLEASHVIPALIRRFHEAKIDGAPAVTLWGTGTPRREFLHVDDLADACVVLMQGDEITSLTNIGCGEDLEIRELAALIRDVVGYSGRIEWDASRPDGTPRKLLDVSRMQARGWRPRIPLHEGVASTYEWYLSSDADGASRGAGELRNA